MERGNRVFHNEVQLIKAFTLNCLSVIVRCVALQLKNGKCAILFFSSGKDKKLFVECIAQVKSLCMC